MADQNDSKQQQTDFNQEDPDTAGARNIGGNPGSQHNDWGHSDAGSGGSMQSNPQSNPQSDLQSELQPDQQGQQQSGQQSGQQAGEGGNIGGVAGSQHNDWGHSPLASEGNLQSGDGGNAQSAQSASSGGARQMPRQGVMPGEEMGHLRPGQDGGAQKR